MAKTLSVQLGDIFKEVEKRIDRATRRASAKAIGKFTKETIVKRSRDGFGVTRTLGNRKRFKSLSPGYIKQRTKTSLDSTTSASRSNITRSGQLLRSLKSRVKPGRITVQPTGNRSGGEGRNSKIADFVEQQGRKFLDLSKKDAQEITRFIQKLIDKALKDI